MKRVWTLLVLVLISTLSISQAATKSHRFENKLTVIVDGNPTYRTESRAASFWVEVVSDSGQSKSEYWKDGHPFVAATKDETYSIRLHNPLPVRVAVNLTVDGLNSITGKPTGIDDGSKWIIEPNSFVEIRGWQVNQSEARHFFTDQHASYADWRGHQLQKNLSANCGVIGAAYFWNKSELQDYYDRHPTYVSTPPQSFAPMLKEMDCFGSAKGAIRREESNMKKSQEMKDRAGTGMGERESHPTETVDFRTDDGMYKVSDAVVIYYDFESTPQPNPFPHLSYAPEMPL